MKKIILLTFTSVSTLVSFCQNYSQYFDGADTIIGSSLVVDLASDTNSIWQVGPPQKTLLNLASTVPNALITDTISPYPASDTSIVYVDLQLDGNTWGIQALEWMQKLDYPYGEEGGVVEFWNPDLENWENCFNNPLVYNYYGFDLSNVELTPYGTLFIGQDLDWKSVWLCFDNSYFSLFSDTIKVRFVHYSDTSTNLHEGWMIDNMIAHPTWIHTIAEKEQVNYMDVYPTVSSGVFHLKGKKKQEFHIIEHIEVFDLNGQLVQSFGQLPTVYTLNLEHLLPGNYRLQITTNFESNSYPIIITK